MREMSMTLAKADRMRLLRIIAAVISAVMLLCACSPSSGDPGSTSDPSSNPNQSADPTPSNPVQGGTLRLSVGPYDSINPLRTSNEDVRLYISSFVCENLIDLDSRMVPSPHILTSWTSDGNAKVWEFKVAGNVEFHSGGYVNATDVKILIDYIIGNGGNYSANVANIAACFAVDDRTIQIILKEADALLPNKLCIPLVGWQTLASDNPTIMEGTGIFKTTEFGNERILLEKNTVYRDRSKLTYFNTVDIGVYASENDKLQSDYDFCIIHGTSVGLKVLRKDTRIYYYRGTEYDYVAINCSSTYLLGNTVEQGGEEKSYIALANPFADARMRMALNLVVSRQNAVNAAASGHAEISLLPLYSGTAYRKRIEADYAYSLEKAINLLKECGYERKPDGSWVDRSGEEFVVSAISPKRNYRMLMAMRETAEGLRSIGVHVEIAEIDDDEYLERLNDKEYMLAAMEIELGMWQDVKAIYGTNGELNFSFYSNDMVDDYIAQVSLQGDPDVVAAAYAQIENIVLTDNPTVGLFIADNAFVIRGRLKGVREESLIPWNPLGSVNEWWIER